MNDNKGLYVIGFIVIAVLVFVGYRIVAVSVGPIRVEFEKPTAPEYVTSVPTEVPVEPAATEAPLFSPKILWTQNCDPRTSSDYCSVSSNLNLFNEFYTTIYSIGGEIVYKLPLSTSDFDKYDLAIVDFCFSSGSSTHTLDNLITVMKQYIQSGGSVIVMGDNFCYPVDFNTSSAQWATELTRDFGITYSRDDDNENDWAEPIVFHPVTNNINKVYSDRHAYLNVSSPSETVYTINGQPFIAIYDGVGKIVAIPDTSFYWGSDFYKGVDLTNNFNFWTNIIVWLAKK